MLLALMVWNCSNDKSPKSSINFRTSKNYSAVQINYNMKKLQLGFPSMMVFIDSSIVISSMKSSNFLTILDLKSNNILELGNKGKGPGELIMPMNINKSQYCWKCFEVYDDGKKNIFTYHIDSCRVSKIKTKPIKAYKAVNTSFKCSSITDSTFLNSGLFDDQFAFRISDNKNKTIAQFGSYNFNPNDKNSPMNKFLAYQGVSSVQDTNFVWACSSAQIIEIFSLKKNCEIVLKKSIIQNFVDYASANQGTGYSSAFKQTNKFTYLNIVTSSDRIYLLYSGKAPSECKSIYDAIKCSEIHVLDWDGNFLEKMILDKEVFNIAISEMDKKLFAIIHEPEPQIVYFQL